MGEMSNLHELVTPKQMNGLFTYDVRYNIPIFQRPYEWNAANAESPVQKLWSDIKKCVEYKSEHYLGAIIIIPENRSLGIPDFLLIDGQQRLTAISILYRAFYDFFTEESESDLKSDCKKYIFTSQGDLKIFRNDGEYRKYDQLMMNIDTPETE